jgi:hypothetical protein
MSENTTGENPHHAAFNEMVVDMCTVQIQYGVAFTNQEIAGDLTRLALEYHDVLPRVAIATLAAIIATLAARDLPSDVRAAIEAGQPHGAH